MKLKNINILYFLLLTGIIVFSCTNPFAPELANLKNEKPLFSDQTTIQGVFDNFRLAYQFKDTMMYGKLLDDNFVFSYRNYDKGIDNNWGRNEDMITTNGLFRAAQSLDLIWNDVIISAGDSLIQDISRGFTLTIVFNPSDIVTVQGRVVLTMKRDSVSLPWKIAVWRDESNY